MPASETNPVQNPPDRPVSVWRPMIFGALALLAVVAVVGLAVMIDRGASDDAASVGGPGSYSTWLWLAGLLAVSALAASIHGWRRAERRAGQAENRLAAVSGTVAGLRELAARREAQVGALRRLSGWVYWEQDASGRYQLIETGADGPLQRLRQLCGSVRESGAQVLDPALWNRVASQIERRQAFDGLRWRRVLAGGDSVEIEEHGRPRFDRDGRFAGYAGVMRERPEVPEPARERFDLGVLAAVPLPVVLIEPGPGQWRLAWANARTSGLTGRNEIELGAIPPSDWIVPAAAATDRAHSGLEQALQNAVPSQRFAASVLDRFGDATPATVVVESRIGPSGQPIHLLLIDTVTPECERLRRLAAGAERARREESARVLELAVTARELESFSHSVSHDLRAPLRVVDGFANILLEDFGADLPAAARTHLNRIVGAAGRMNEMIDALLALARISSQPVIPEPVDLSTLARGVVDELRQREPERQVAIELQPRMQCRGDRVLLRIVIENLLGNAWKYSSQTPDARIAFDSELVDGVTIYRVSDNGTGFDMCFADQLFQIFRRLHSANDFPGTGIGLATVQRIIRRHGGRVWAESEPGNGARFYFTLWDEPTLDRAARLPIIPPGPNAARH